MTRRSARRCGAVAGLTLALCMQASGDERLREEIREQLRADSYVLVEDGSSIRLYVLSDAAEAAELPPLLAPPPGSVGAALAMVHSADHRIRVRGLTLLAGSDDAAARDAALTLLNDPAEAVREEAYILLLEHPAAEHAGIAAIGGADSSPRVRKAVADALDQHTGD